jgi:hypothetical protein
MRNSEYLYLHPNQENPTSVRLQIRPLGIQQYFPFKTFGKRKAWQLAKETRDLYMDKLRIVNMRHELGFNKLFSKDGHLINLKMHKRNKKGKRYIIMLAQVSEHAKITFRKEKNLTPDHFDEAFEVLTQMIFDYHGITPDHEIKRQMKKTRMIYVREFNEYWENFMVI